jgi:hypothetical protein
MQRSGKVAGYFAVSAACFCGAMGVSLWAPASAAAMLLILSLILHEPIYARYEQSQRIMAQSRLLAGSIANATLTAAVAYEAGSMIARAWAL